MRREFIRDLPHRPEAGVRDDRLFVLELALRHPRVAVYERTAFAHRQHARARLQTPGALQSTVVNYQHLSIYRRILNELELRHELTERRRLAATKSLWVVAHWLAYSHLAEAAAVARWVYKLIPAFKPPEPGILGWMYRHLGFVGTERLLRLRRLLLRGR
jgi:hypothetical protein